MLRRLTLYALSLSLLLVAILRFIGGGAVAEPSVVPADAPAPTGLPAVPSVAWSDPAWTTRMAAGAAVRFQIEGQSAAWELQGLGPLDSSAKAEMRRRFERKLISAEMKRARLLAKIPTEASAQENHAAQALAHDAYMECLRAQLDMIESDKYIVIECAAGRLPLATVPGAKVLTNNFVRSNGKNVDVLFVVYERDYPEFRKAREAVRNFADYRLEAICATFNALPVTERAERARVHASAQLKLQGGPPTEMPQSERDRWEADLMAQCLPFGVMVDKTTLTMSPKLGWNASN